MHDTKERINKMLKKSEAILQAGKPKPMTNEEWLHTLTTEEKAKRIVNLAVNSDCDYRTIVRWLKEKHHE